MQELLFHKDQLSQVVKTILNGCKDVQGITLQGTLGAGKTTFAIELLKQLGVQSEMQSPTYTYLQMYTNHEGKKLYHFDLYRLQNKEAFLFAGFDEFLYQPNSLVIIEWPEIIQDIVDHKVCRIVLEYKGDTARKLSWDIK